MPDVLPRYVSLVFEAVVLLTFLLFMRAVRHTPTKGNGLVTGIGLSLAVWMLVQSLLAGAELFPLHRKYSTEVSDYSTACPTGCNTQPCHTAQS